MSIGLSSGDIRKKNVRKWSQSEHTQRHSKARSISLSDAAGVHRILSSQQLHRCRSFSIQGLLTYRPVQLASGSCRLPSWQREKERETERAASRLLGAYATVGHYMVRMRIAMIASVRIETRRRWAGLMLSKAHKIGQCGVLLSTDGQSMVHKRKLQNKLAFK